MPRQFVQLSSTGQLHRMEAGHAGSNASAPIDIRLVTLSKYDLCNLPGCWPKDRLAPLASAPGEPAQRTAQSGSRRNTRHHRGVTTHE